MSTSVAAVLLGLATIATLLFSTLTFALRDFSRTKICELFERRNRSEASADLTIERAPQLAVITGIGRLVANMVMLLGVLALFSRGSAATPGDYVSALAAAGLLGLIVSVMLPHTVAEHFGEVLIVTFATPLNASRVIFMPILKTLHVVDNVVRKAARNGDSADVEAEEEFEQEILNLTEEAEEEGLVDEHDRELIESVFEFRDLTAGQVMTARPDIDALPVESTLDEVRERIETSGHSRIPVYEGSLDKLQGVLYARDLMHLVGQPRNGFTLQKILRKAMFVHESKMLSDLLQDFREQKVHMAIVRDEHGTVSGLVTIEDVLEALVGEISDEHEPVEEPHFKRLGHDAAEADARLRIEDLNRQFNLELPEDEGFDTVGGFVSTRMGKIPAVGESLEAHGVRFTVIEAEPQRVNRVRLELTPEQVA